MISNILRNLFTKPATKQYPFVKREPFPESRGLLKFDMTKCDFCGDCERICPSGAVTVDEEKKQIHYNPFQCIYCRMCAESCLQYAITAEVVYQAPAYEKKEEVYTPEEEKAEEAG
jgi:formate hydrogenlyase subunit 6/NADH:ubiquinone oxidoreductase subunit I